MQPFAKLTSIVAPLDRVDVDTDQIIPKQFLKRIERTGFGQFMFFDWRFKEDGTPNPDFELNKPAYKSANILVTGRNFGCGSSREHAPWALLDYGFKVIIATSFADIFYSNCFQNGILPIALPEPVVKKIIEKAQNGPGYKLNIDLATQRVWDNDEDVVVEFTIDPFRKHCLLNGLDDIGLTLQFEDKIAAYEARAGV